MSGNLFITPINDKSIDRFYVPFEKLSPFPRLGYCRTLFRRIQSTNTNLQGIALTVSVVSKKEFEKNITKIHEFTEDERFCVMTFEKGELISLAITETWQEKMKSYGATKILIEVQGTFFSTKNSVKIEVLKSDLHDRLAHNLKVYTFHRHEDKLALPFVTNLFFR